MQITHVFKSFDKKICLSLHFKQQSDINKPRIQNHIFDIFIHSVSSHVMVCYQEVERWTQIE